MGRLRDETLIRAECFADRVLDVSDTLERVRGARRVVDQVSGSGTSVGANLFEADQAISPNDFIKTLGIVVKELTETKFWLRLIGRRGWLKPARLADLLDETEQLLSIFNAVMVNTRRGSTATKRRQLQ